MFDCRRQGGQHLAAGLPHGQPADPVSVEVQVHRSLGAFGPHRLADTALDNSEQRLIGSIVSLSSSCRPCPRAFHSKSHHLWRAWQRRAHVEHHLDVGTQQLLGLDRALRCEPVGGAVVGAAERDAVVVHLRLEREDLESARVGQGQPAPICELPETTEVGDRLGARAQHQVIGVAEHDLSAEPLVVRGGQVLDRRSRPHRHEARGPVRSACGVADTATRRTVGGDELELDGAHQRLLSSSIASPKDKNR